MVDFRLRRRCFRFRSGDVLPGGGSELTELPEPAKIRLGEVHPRAGFDLFPMQFCDLRTGDHREDGPSPDTVSGSGVHALDAAADHRGDLLHALLVRLDRPGRLQRRHSGSLCHLVVLDARCGDSLRRELDRTSRLAFVVLSGFLLFRMLGRLLRATAPDERRDGEE